MRELLRSHSLSYVQGLQLALEAQGIKTALLDQQSIGFMGFAGRVRLAVTNDADYQRALEVVRSLEPPRHQAVTPASWKLQRWGCAWLVVGFGLLLIGSAAAENTSGPLKYGLLIAAIALLAFGIALVVLGPRRDRQRRQ